MVQWVKPLPARRATATCRPRKDGGTDIIIVVSGPSALPDENQEYGAQPRLEVEILRYRLHGECIVEEETAKEADGKKDAICTTWAAAPSSGGASCGLVRAIPGGLSWTCMFTLPGPLNDNGWLHAAIVCEARSSKKALVLEDKIERGETGPTFHARIELDPNGSK
jgi:hypothetical protein